MVTLVPITRDNWRSTLEVRVQPERLEWVASREPVALMLLAKSYVRPDGQLWHPFAITAQDDSNETDAVVGVVAIGTAGDVAWLHHFLIDDRQQGRGHGRAAMLAVGEWLRREHPRVTRLGLNVVAENEVAFGLYRSLGFEKVGVTLDGQQITIALVDELL